MTLWVPWGVKRPTPSEEVKPPAENEHIGIGYAKAQQKRFVGLADDARKRCDIAAKALATVGSTGLTVVGLGKFPDAFPVPDGTKYGELLVCLVVVGFLTMASAVLWMMWRFSRATRAVITSADEEETCTEGVKGERLSEDEQELVRRVFRDQAALNDAPTLLAYQARGLRLETLAFRESDAAERKQLEEEAAQIRAEVLATRDRATALIVRHRTSSRRAVAHVVGAGAVFVLGLIAMSLSGDRLAAARDEPTRCAAAAKALAGANVAKEDAAKLLGTCPPAEPKPTPTPTPPGPPVPPSPPPTPGPASAPDVTVSTGPINVSHDPPVVVPAPAPARTERSLTATATVTAPRESTPAPPALSPTPAAEDPRLVLDTGPATVRVPRLPAAAP